MNLYSIDKERALGEAMACALPCVTTDAGDSNFLLDDARWVVPVESPGLLARRLSAMLDLTANDRKLLGQRNAERIRNVFTIQGTWRRYLELYEKLPEFCQS